MNLEKYKKANIATNMAYSVAEAANSFAVDAESELRKIHSGLKYDEKHKFKLMVEAAEKLKNTSKFVAKPLYQINDSEMALSDSDWLYDFFARFNIHNQYKVRHTYNGRTDETYAYKFNDKYHVSRSRSII